MDIAHPQEGAESDDQAAEAARRPAEVEPEGTRDLVLVLERHPDGAPVAHALVDVEPHTNEGEGPWLRTAADGRLSVRVPALARALRVVAAGFEPEEEPLSRDARELRLALTPSSGLFGRVLRPDGTPAAGAAVGLATSRWTAQLDLSERRPQPMAIAQELTRLAASGTADEEGWYVLPYPTRAASETVELRAELAELDGQLAVTLPREPELLPDLVLRPPATVLVVRVLDTDGRPIPDALVRGEGHPLASGRDRTDERGELVITSPRLPATFYAYALGHFEHESSHDGRVVPWSTPVEAPTETVEIVLAPVAGVRVRIVDAQTRFPIYLAHCRCELVAGGETVGRSDFGPDREGVAWVSFQDTHQMTDPPVVAERARLTVDREGYEPNQVFELDARAASGPEPIELALRPLADYAVLRGRVERAGVPLPRFQVALKAMPRVPDPSRLGWQYARTYTDAAGRFALRWKRDGSEQTVTVFPHWTSWDEFAFLGPMSEAAATEQEHVLELRPAEHVPAVLRGVVRGGRYRYYVSLLGGDDRDPIVVPTTVNGVPLAADTDGELRTLLRLPADRRVQVTVGYGGENRVHPDGCAPVEHDPARPSLPLVFELQPLFLRVRGSVVGLAPAELARVGVTILSSDEEESSRRGELTRVQPDGSFELQAPRGNHELFLIEVATGEWRSILARQPLVLDRDVEGLRLVPDPSGSPR
jgi:hypothetical protein